jgi:hypothetical protein
MREITQERVDRNLRFLEDVYKLSNKKFTKITQSEVVLKHKVSCQCFVILARLGWLEKKGDKISSLYKWKTSIPNPQMARMLIIEASLYRSKKLANLKSINNKKIVRTKKVISEIKTKKEVSILWGLIKIKY